MSRLAAFVLLAALLNGCQSAGPTPTGSTSDAAPACVTLPDAVEAMAWSVSGDALFAMYGPLVSEGWTLVKVDPVTLAYANAGLAEWSTGPLAVDGNGSPVWITQDPATGVNNLTQWSADGPTVLGVLPHPRFEHLAWTSAGLVALEYTISEVEAGPESARLVRFDVSGPMINLVPLSPFRPEVTDISASLDGGTTATSVGFHRPQTIDYAQGSNHTIGSPDGVDSVELWGGGRRVGYHSNGGSYRTWEPATGSDRLVTDAWIYSSALTDAGVLAMAIRSETEGRTGKICLQTIPPN